MIPLCVWRLNDEAAIRVHLLLYAAGSVHNITWACSKILGLLSDAAMSE